MMRAIDGRTRPAMRLRRYVWHWLAFGVTADARHALECEHYRRTIRYLEDR
jgi:hypothetical protein